MYKRSLLILVIVLFAFISLGWKTHVRIGSEFDPREPLRIVVLPTKISTKLKGVEARTVSALYATELVRKYDVLDLARFEQYLKDNRLSLEKALSVKGRQVVLDSARVNAIATIEIYRWAIGEAGGMLGGGTPAKLGLRVRLTEPYSGQIIWSVNRIYKLKGGAHFFDSITPIFVDLVNDLDRDLKKQAKQKDREERYAARQAKKVSKKIRKQQGKTEVAMEKGKVTYEVTEPVFPTIREDEVSTIEESLEETQVEEVDEIKPEPGTEDQQDESSGQDIEIQEAGVEVDGTENQGDEQSEETGENQEQVE